MITHLQFREVASSEYFGAFCKIVDKHNYIDWESLGTHGCADYEFQNQHITFELEKMKELTMLFNKYLDKVTPC